MGMNLAQFKEFNKSKGFHWFNNDTMRFFKSRASNWDYISGLFISSERGPIDGARFFTIRKADFKTGNIATIGQFQQYKTLAAAKTKLRIALRNGV